MHFQNAQKPPRSQRFRSRNSTLQHGQQVWQWFPTFRGNDHLGSSQIGFDLSGIVDFQEYYTPFGEVENASPLNDNMIGNSPHTTAVVFFAYFRFTGSKIMPSAYRLQSMQARLQDPVTGRFLSIDPVGFASTGHPGMVNRFSYTYNDPMNLIDPTGEQSCGADCPPVNRELSDSISEQRLQGLSPSIQQNTRQFINTIENNFGTTLRIAQGFRSIEQQNALFNQCRNGNPGIIVTDRRGGQSYHNFGLAFDVVPLTDGGAINWAPTSPDWNTIGATGEQFGFTWGARWKTNTDRPHFQNNFGIHHSQLNEWIDNGRSVVDIPGRRIFTSRTRPTEILVTPILRGSHSRISPSHHIPQ